MTSLKEYKLYYQQSKGLLSGKATNQVSGSNQTDQAKNQKYEDLKEESEAETIRLKENHLKYKKEMKAENKKLQQQVEKD